MGWDGMDGMDGIGSPGGRGYRAPYGANNGLTIPIILLEGHMYILQPFEAKDYRDLKAQ